MMNSQFQHQHQKDCASSCNTTMDLHVGPGIKWARSLSPSQVPMEKPQLLGAQSLASINACRACDQVLLNHTLHLFPVTWIDMENKSETRIVLCEDEGISE